MPDKPLTRVEIDPNDRSPDDGGVRVWGKNVLGPIVLGALVQVFEPEAGLVGWGHIERYDEEYDLVYVSVDWDSIWFEEDGGPHG